MSVDPHPEVVHYASIIVDCTHEALVKSPMGAQWSSSSLMISSDYHDEWKKAGTSESSPS